MSTVSLNKLDPSYLAVSYPSIFAELETVDGLNDYSLVRSSSHRFATWISVKCGHSFEMRVYNRVRSRSHCPYCSGQAVLEGFNDLATTHSKLASEWSQKNSLKANEVVAGSHKVAIWECKNKHEWEAPVYSRAHKGNGCGTCSNQVSVLGVNDRLTRQGDEIRLDWASTNLISIEEAFSHDPAATRDWECKRCSTRWTASIDSRLVGWRRCPSCYTSSHLESTVALFLEDHGISYRWNTRPLKISSNGKRSLQIDFLLTDELIGFEVQDFATHSKTEDDSTTPAYWGKAKKKGPEYHENKRRLAKDQLGVRLIDLWEDEVRNGDYKNIILEAIAEVKRA